MPLIGGFSRAREVAYSDLPDEKETDFSQSQASDKKEKTAGMAEKGLTAHDPHTRRSLLHSSSTSDEDALDWRLNFNHMYICNKFVIGLYYIRHVLANSAPVDEHFAIVQSNHVQSSKERSDIYAAATGEPTLLSGEICVALNNEVLRADEGGMRREWSRVETQGREKRDISEKTRRTRGIVRTIPTCENQGATPPGIELVSTQWEASSLTTTPLQPPYKLVLSYIDGNNGRATVAERLACSPPTTAIRVQSSAGSLRIFSCGNCAGRCRWSAGFLGGSPVSPALSFWRCSVLTSITLFGSQDLDVKSRPKSLHFTA
ncbi:hypothetical protein PR048_025761 [Dryococelus australis]|uniref:Uncharacterized protein n=1 Tax=Dryococelus australis TaxID=614101 RepID=A0ABQ9GJG2_9NEOP|nr:hypothetical protein PR048_025761 [Dryococelus australis]